MYKKLKKYAHEVILVPDADATGKRVGKELALEFLSVRTLWLDQFLVAFFRCLRMTGLSVLVPVAKYAATCITDFQHTVESIFSRTTIQ